MINFFFFFVFLKQTLIYSIYYNIYSTGPTINIDFHTEYSYVGILKNGAIEMFSDKFGNNKIPNMLAFMDNDYDYFIGEEAKIQSKINPNKTIYNIEKLIGSNYRDENVQEFIKSVPFEVLNQEGRPHISVIIRGRKILFSPEEILLMFLQKLKIKIENYLATPVKFVLMTVPFSFTKIQR